MGVFIVLFRFFLMGENVQNLQMFMRRCRKTMRCIGQLRFVCHFGQRRRGLGFQRESRQFTGRRERERVNMW